MRLGERVIVINGDMNRNKKTDNSKQTHEHKKEKSWKTTEEVPVNCQGNAHTGTRRNTEECQALAERMGCTAYLSHFPETNAAKWKDRPPQKTLQP